MALAGRSIQPKRQWSDLDGLKRRAGRSQQTNTDDMIWIWDDMFGLVDPEFDGYVVIYILYNL